MKIPDFKKLSLEQFEGADENMKLLIDVLNQNLEPLFRAIKGRLIFGENIFSEVLTTKLEDVTERTLKLQTIGTGAFAVANFIGFFGPHGFGYEFPQPGKIRVIANFFDVPAEPVKTQILVIGSPP